MNKHIRINNSALLWIFVLGLLFAAFILDFVLSPPKENTYLIANLYDSQMEVNSPEWLAKTSSDAFIRAMNGEITAEELFNVTSVLSASSKEDLFSEKGAFISSVNQSKSYFSQNSMCIKQVLFARTEYLDEDWACIRRIHRYNTGKEYYFCQYYKNTEDGWKIETDTLANDFQLKKKVLFWYIDA